MSEKFLIGQPDLELWSQEINKSHNTVGDFAINTGQMKPTYDYVYKWLCILTDVTWVRIIK